MICWKESIAAILSGGSPAKPGQRSEKRSKAHQPERPQAERRRPGCEGGESVAALDLPGENAAGEALQHVCHAALVVDDGRRPGIGGADDGPCEFKGAHAADVEMLVDGDG